MGYSHIISTLTHTSTLRKLSLIYIPAKTYTSLISTFNYIHISLRTQTTCILHTYTWLNLHKSHLHLPYLHTHLRTYIYTHFLTHLTCDSSFILISSPTLTAHVSRLFSTYTLYSAAIIAFTCHVVFYSRMFLYFGFVRPSLWIVFSLLTSLTVLSNPTTNCSPLFSYWLMNLVISLFSSLTHATPLS